MSPRIRILCLGDVVGSPGREIIRRTLPTLRQREGIDLVVVNAENAAAGSGLNEKSVSQLLDAGADVLTSGDHIWRKKEVFPLIPIQPRLLRPANLPPESPGHGSGIFTTADGVAVGVINLLGRVFMNPIDCPFRAADREIAALSRRTSIIIIDFHAEASAEKIALGYHCLGRVSAVVGTHTHVPTADERILGERTAFITDLGMCGGADSIIGREIEPVLKNFTTKLPAYFTVAGGRLILEGAIVEIATETGRALSIRRVREELYSESNPGPRRRE